MYGPFDLSAFGENIFANLSYLHLFGTGERSYLIDISGIEAVNTLKTLEITYPSTSCIDFSKIGQLTNLTSLTITNSNLSDITFVKSLTKLKTLVLNDNKISSCVPLKDLKSLSSLNLENNNLSVYSSLNGERYENLKILADLNINNKFGKLTEIYLKGNPELQDFSTLTANGLTWTKKSGF